MLGAQSRPGKGSHDRHTALSRLRPNTAAPEGKLGRLRSRRNSRKLRKLNRKILRVPKTLILPRPCDEGRLHGDRSQQRSSLTVVIRVLVEGVIDQSVWASLSPQVPLGDLSFCQGDFTSITARLTIAFHDLERGQKP